MLTPVNSEGKVTMLTIEVDLKLSSDLSASYAHTIQFRGRSDYACH
jgi:hypothetical protein